LPKSKPLPNYQLSVWDRRAVIGGSYKLASVAGFESIYISPDESLDTRRCRIMDRLTKKATTEGKEVTVADGVVSIDGCIVFSLKQGFIRNNDD